MLRLVWLAWLTQFGSSQAWLRGSDGRAQWDYEWHFEGFELLSLESEPSSHCAELCITEASCSHWTWTSASDGTCQLKQGATNAVVLHASHLCGFLPARFAPDETRAYDFGLTLSEDTEDDMTEDDAETALRMLNSFRTKRGKSKLSVDARLVLIAHELTTTCRAVPFTTNMNDGEGYEFFPALPTSMTPRDFTGEVHAISVAAPPDSSVKHAIEWWTSAIDSRTGAKPFYSDGVGIVGLAKRQVSSCWESKVNSSGNGGSSFDIVWTMLLAKYE
ncbi:hypothetical protein AM587_10006819 [Phytophthora nicotianae]|uniref:Apple domain-containing protein n=1 Tax=Phytophthora nicotianae TaxID=4792 RepID=A0A0W8C4A8_PHYNI|nr:hypothetical protein AM587_10006819 [Phytophthora nicotianae]